MVGLLGDAFESEILRDPAESAIREQLKRLPGSIPGGPLVVVWCGHAVGSDADSLRLLAHDSPPDPWAGMGISDLVAPCAASGANQLLFVVDTCFSGAAVAAGDVAARIMRIKPPRGEYMWVGVLASCLELETARDGLFGLRLRDVLTNGPKTPELRVRWSSHNRFVRGDDVCDAILKDWDSDVQSPDFSSRGSAWWVFPNPLYNAEAPEQVVEHLLQAARGGARLDERSWFTGRTLEVNRVVGWVRSGRPGIYVVTGSAGTGKSAIAGRVVSLSNPAERERLLGEGVHWAHADPGARSVHAHVYARGLTADRAAALIADQLVTAKVLEPQPEPRNASELVGQVQRAVEQGQAPPVMLVDGLDEARGEAFAIAEDLLARLAPYAVIVVATRELRRGDDRPSLLGVLAPGGAGLDLDDPAGQDRTRADLAGYITARLAGRDPRMDAQAVAAYFTGQASMTADRPFLLARLVTDQLLASPVDTGASGWPDQVSMSIETAFDADLSAVGSPDHRQAGRGADGAGLARSLLRALTWGYGRGFPEEEWLAAANTVSPGTGFDRDDVLWLLGQLGRYILQDGEAGVAVYRMAHQSLAEHLRQAFRPRPGQLFDPQALPVTLALANRYHTLLDGGVTVTDPAYLWRYLWRHVADCGPAGLAILRELALANGALQPDVATAALQIADRLQQWGRLQDAVAPTEEAVRLRRDLARDNPAFLPDLAMALNNLGISYSEVGRRLDAVAPAEEAVRLYRDLARDNPAFLPDLASALNNLGVRYSEVGRRQNTATLIEEAVRLYRDLARDNPAFLPDLAVALNNLGVSYSGVGRRQDGVAPTEEAVRLRRDLARDNPAFLPDLASALNNLGVRYSGVGRRQDAVAPTEEAVRLYRDLARDNPASLPDLAMALTNLGVRYSEAGSPESGEVAWREALVEIPPSGRALLLTARAAAADAGHVEAARWLATGLQHAADDRGLTVAIHQQARRHWSANPAAFSSAWEHYTGQQIPAWLSVDRGLLETAEAWIGTETYTAERDFLASHPRLLDPAADNAVGEALLSVSEDAAQRYTALRETARAQGVEAAYRPLLLTILAREFTQADPDAQAALLATRLDDLLSATVRDTIETLADQDNAQAHRAKALLDLAALGEHEPVVEALIAPARFPSIMHDLACRPDPVALGPAATVALTAASTTGKAAAAIFYLAVSVACAGSPDSATETLIQARRLDPDQAPAWIGELANIGQHHPAVLPLIPVLTQPMDDTGAPGPAAATDEKRGGGDDID